MRYIIIFCLQLFSLICFSQSLNSNFKTQLKFEGGVLIVQLKYDQHDNLQVRSSENINLLLGGIQIPFCIKNNGLKNLEVDSYFDDMYIYANEYKPSIGNEVYYLVDMIPNEHFRKSNYLTSGEWIDLFSIKGLQNLSTDNFKIIKDYDNLYLPYIGFVTDYGIEEYILSDDKYDIKSIRLNVIPNPSNGKFKIAIDENIILSSNQVKKIKVSDINGKIIKEINFIENNMEIDLTEFPSNPYYFLIFVNGELIFNKSVIKI